MVAYLMLRKITLVFGAEGGSQNATLIVVVVLLLLLVLIISSLKISKAFLMRSATQRSSAYTFMLIFDPYRSTVSDFSINL